MGMCWVSALLLKPWISFFVQHCLMWAALASFLQCIPLTGNRTQVLRFLLIVIEHNGHNSKEKAMPFFVIHSVPSFLLPMEYTDSILHRIRYFSYLGVWVKNTCLQLNSDRDCVLLVRKGECFKTQQHSVFPMLF